MTRTWTVPVAAGLGAVAAGLLVALALMKGLRRLRSGGQTEATRAARRRAVQLLRSGGPPSEAEAGPRPLGRELTVRLNRERYRLLDRAFDLRFRIESGREVHIDLLTIHTPHTQWEPIRGTKRIQTASQAEARAAIAGSAGQPLYRPAAVLTLHQSFKLLPADLRRWTFVDYGSGKGRVLVFAGRYPFQRVIGLEFADELHEQAVRNVATARRWLPCQSIEALHVDALDFEPPTGPCVFFFFNPFVPDVMEGVVQRIRTSMLDRPRPAVLMALGNCPVDLFDGLEGFRLMGSKSEVPGLVPRPAMGRFRVYANDRANRPLD